MITLSKETRSDASNIFKHIVAFLKIVLQFFFFLDVKKELVYYKTGRQTCIIFKMFVAQEAVDMSLCLYWCMFMYARII